MKIQELQIEIAPLHNEKISKCTSITYRVRNRIDIHAVSKLHCALILLYISYCTELWSNTYSIEQDTLSALLQSTQL